MAETVGRGPFVNTGSLMDGSVNPMDGPSVDYQANVVPDPRAANPIRKDGLQPGRVPGFFNNPYFVLTDNIPAPFSTSILAAAQTAVTSQAFTLNGTTASTFAAGTQGPATNIPLIPLGTSLVATSAIALDFGFATGTSAANSSTVVVVDSTLFNQGDWIIVAGAGNSGNTQPLFTQVASAVNATTIQVSPVAVGALSNAPIGHANLYGSGLLPPATQFGPAAPAPNAANPYIVGGLSAVFNPLEALARNVCVACNTAVGGTSAVLVKGWDVYGQPMSELITASGTTAIFGKKAFKYIQNAVAQNAGGANYTLGFGDTFGFHARSDKWEFTNIFWNGAFATNNNGWTKAVITSPNTNTAGDVRGTVQVSTAGSLGTSVAAAASNGTARLTLFMSVPVFNMLNATPVNTVPLFGVANSTT